jgi:antirestriction protein ArdC
MSRYATKPQRDVAAEITALIIAKLEAGVPPWSRPWTGGGATGGPLRHCGTPYTGINRLYLWAVADSCGYTSRYWMTYRQAGELGGQVRKGEKSALSVYYNSVSRTEADPRTGEESQKNIRFLRAYSVFNAAQIDGLPNYFYPDTAEPTPVEPSVRQGSIDAFFSAIPANVRHGGNQAYFSPTFDYIQLPEPRAFKSIDHYASTRAHESVHWSGHKDRLARTFGNRFGDKAYSAEELVAEIGAGFICAELGLPNELHDSHASYVGHWLGLLKGDKTAIIHAASKAEQALTYLRGFSAGDASTIDGEPLAKAA